MQKTRVLNLNGSPYENGKVSGEYFRANVNLNVEEYEKILKNNILMKRQVEYQFNNLKSKFSKYYDEVIGKADGLMIDRMVYFTILCPELLDLNIEHCTTVIYKKDNGKYIISHNEDDTFLDGNFCLSKVKIDNDNYFVTNDMYNMPFGNGISWNSYGIVKTINYCHDDNINLNYLPRYFSQRHISEAKSLQDLIKRCKEIETASGYHINAIDINNNIAVSIEVHSEGVDVEYITDFYIHSNHFIHGKYVNNQNTGEGSNSIFRLNKATELIRDCNRNIEGIKKVLDYRSIEDTYYNSIYQTKSDPYETLFNFSYDTENRDNIFLDIYVNNEKLILDYNIS